MQSKKRRIWGISCAVALAGVFLAAFAVTGASGDSTTPASTNPRVQAAERLVIRYSTSGFELLSRTPVQKVLPPSVELPAAKGTVRGSWFEIQSEAGTVMYRRRMDSPRMVYTEAPTADDPGVLKRDEVAVDENVFSVLVPAGADAKSLVFYDSSTDIKKRSEAASEVGRIGLR